jgi:hypothetical protein
MRLIRGMNQEELAGWVGYMLLGLSLVIRNLVISWLEA